MIFRNLKDGFLQIYQTLFKEKQMISRSKNVLNVKEKLESSGWRLIAESDTGSSDAMYDLFFIDDDGQERFIKVMPCMKVLKSMMSHWFYKRVCEIAFPHESSVVIANPGAVIEGFPKGFNKSSSWIDEGVYLVSKRDASNYVEGIKQKTVVY